MRCFFFDRDGVVNESPGPGAYVTRWEDFRLLPGFVRALRRVTGAGYGAVIVTNQRAVALGLMTEADLAAIHAGLRRVLREEHGLALTDILYCPHDRGGCTCRKPQPGMLLEAARRHGIELSQSWMVGDSERDIEAGHRAGCGCILVAGGAGPTAAEYVVPSMDGLDSLIAEEVLRP